MKRWSYIAHMKLCLPNIWVTAKGEPVTVAGMGDCHLVSTVELLRRKAPAAKMVDLLGLLAGPRPRGDLATDGFNDVLEEAANETLDTFLIRTCPPFEAMLRRYDACKRRLRAEEDRFLDEAIEDPWGNS